MIEILYLSIRYVLIMRDKPCLPKAAIVTQRMTEVIRDGFTPQRLKRFTAPGIGNSLISQVTYNICPAYVMAACRDVSIPQYCHIDKRPAAIWPSRDFPVEKITVINNLKILTIKRIYLHLVCEIDPFIYEIRYILRAMIIIRQIDNYLRSIGSPSLINKINYILFYN